MSLTNVESEKLFAKILLVSVKEDSTNQCRKTELFITVERHSANSILNRQELVVRLTDNKDPFFLYTINLNEEDFQSLKSQQGLLVDFSAFPQKFIDLLELCLQEEHKELPSYATLDDWLTACCCGYFIYHHIRFLLTVDVKENLGSGLNPVQLNVVETNPFKHLTHLSLKLHAATDSSVKKYLATCFKRLKDERDQLKSELECMENDMKSKLSSNQEIILSKTLQLERLQKEFKVELAAKESKHTEELQLERERLLAIQRDGDQRWEKERREKEQNYRKHTQQLEARVSCLDSLNKELQDKQYKSETTVRELRSRLISLEEEVKQTHQRLQNISKEKALVDANLNEKNMTLSQMKSQITELEQDIEVKARLISRLQDQLKIALDEKRKLEDILMQKQTTLEKRESSLKSLSEEILKANEIIRKLQVELRSNHEKLKMRGKIAMKQEKCLSGKEDQLQKLQEEAFSVKEQLREKEQKNKELRDTLAALNEKVEGYQNQVKTNENVIKWLNKQLTDAQLAQQKPTLIDPASTLNSVQEHPFVVSKPGIFNSTAHGILTSSRVPPLSSSTPFTVVNSGISRNVNPVYGESPAFTLVASNTTNAATVSLPASKNHQLSKGGLDARYLQKHFAPHQTYNFSSGFSSTVSYNTKEKPSAYSMPLSGNQNLSGNVTSAQTNVVTPVVDSAIQLKPSNAPSSIVTDTKNVSSDTKTTSLQKSSKND